MTFLIQQTLIYAVPLMIVALAGVFAERSGIINLALEGIMIFGAFIGVLFVRMMQGSAMVLAAKQAGDWMALQGLELLAMLEEEGRKKEKHVRLSLNWPQAVMLIRYEDLPSEEKLIMEEANEGERYEEQD